MKWIVNDPFGFATSLKSFAGANVTLANTSATDIYYDVEQNAGTLNASAPGAIPTGTKLAATSGFIQFNECPRDLWVRSATQTVLDVHAIAPAAVKQVQPVRAGDMRGSNNVFKPTPPSRPIFGNTKMS